MSKIKPGPIFNPDKIASERLQKILQKPGARNILAIHFTPRSGSSWLTGIVEACGELGFANEAFNPRFCQNWSENFGISSIDQHIEFTTRNYNANGVASFEITAHQLKRTFENPDKFFSVFKNCPSYWLIREDIVLQAVSLAKMVTKGVSHSTENNARDHISADQSFEYDAALIKKWAMHILKAEQLSEQWFKQYEISPLRMSYERMIILPPKKILNLLARHAGLPDVSEPDIEPRHSKVGTSRNEEFAARFRSEEKRWVRDVEAERAGRLARLDDLASLVSDV